MLKEFKDSLTKLGLTEKESKVYLVLLNEGSATADKISKLAALNRSTTYVQIETLSKLGLVSTFKKGKKTFFAAESPMNLSRVIETKARTLENQKTEVGILLPELMKVFSSTGIRPVVRLFEGKEGLTSMRTEMLNSGTKEILVATAYDSFKSIFTEEELNAYTSQRIKKNITSKVLYTKVSSEDLKVAPPQEVRRIDAKQFPFSSEVYIYGNTVSFISTEEYVAGVVVESEHISLTMKSLFYLAWQSADLPQ